jgi:hypothetical protein
LATAASSAAVSAAASPGNSSASLRAMSPASTISLLPSRGVPVSKDLVR